ncbi:MAG TPA: anti-sigma factor [Xanthobacteraceae bacterium]|jgi:anti-sigma factor RsiW
MSDPHVPVTEDELHALVDGELAEDRRLDVEAWLASHPEDAARVAAWRAQAELIRNRYAAVAEEPVPPRLQVERLAGRHRFRRALAAAAAVLLFLTGGLAGWLGRGFWEGAPAAKAITAEAVIAHRLYVAEVRHPVEVPAAESQHLVQWLSRRVGQDLRAPDLQKLGLALVGGRLLPGPEAAAAFFMYEGQSGERFTLYCSRATGPDTALRYRAAGQVAAFYWLEKDFSCVVSGPAERGRLQSVAQSVYDQFDSGRMRPNERRSTLLMR